MRLYRTALILLLSLSFSLSAKDPEFLFVLFDAGETNAFLPLFEKLEKEKREFAIWTAGTATELVRKRPSLLAHAREIDSTIDKSWPREKGVDSARLNTLSKECHPQVVITGVASEIQAQVLQAFKGKARTLAYWDNFSAQGANPYFTTAHRVQQCADKVLFPSRDVAQAPDFSSRPSSVVGHPNTEEWTRELSSIDEKRVREKFALKTALITYVGSYGPEYEKAAKLFVQCVKESGFSGKVLMQIHPKSDGVFERALCSGENFLFLPLSTLEAVKLADCVVCYNSTVGFQALFAHKRVLFVIPEEDLFTNLAIEKGFAPKISRPDAFLPALNGSKVSKEIGIEMGVPEESIQHLFEAITQTSHLKAF